MFPELFPIRSVRFFYFAVLLRLARTNEVMRDFLFVASFGENVHSRKGSVAFVVSVVPVGKDRSVIGFDAKNSKGGDLNQGIEKVQGAADVLLGIHF